MNSKFIRESFIEFFKQKGHTYVPSSSLIPKKDPTLLYTSAGMVQFKPFWSGEVIPTYKRACSIQKCLRSTDLEKVGKKLKYLTFFEMLGNFSFGDYFKEDAIIWAWEYITKILNIPKEKLYVTVFEEDEEAFNIWKDEIGFPKERIYKLGEEDNFWGPAGKTGACGPCSEIFFDMGEEFGCKKIDCKPGCECNRYIEVWNLVFPQYDQQIDGKRLPLKNRGIDTGMGLERATMVIEEKKNLFETELFLPVVERIADGLNIKLSEETKIPLYAAADHTRALIFAITDGAIPSNEERGYVLRRILRRALKELNRFGITKPVLYLGAGVVVEIMKEFYPELEKRREIAGLIIKSEEERFLNTLKSGLVLFESTAVKYKDKGSIPGKEIFKLYDTYGFPFELTKEMAEEKGLSVSLEEFEREMAYQRNQSRKSAQFIKNTEWIMLKEGKGEFVGYETDEVETEILRYRKEGDKVALVLKASPFYAEAGGQVGDTGWIKGKELKIEVCDTVQEGEFKVVLGNIKEGEIESANKVYAKINIERRREIERAHTATHLFHAALRKIIGDFARQEGSLVEDGRLRFDFTSPRPLTRNELKEIEDEVYAQIIKDVEVKKYLTTLEQAREKGALAFFGEEYGEIVRVVEIQEFSKELCGGTHIRRTGEIGNFLLLHETGVAAGIRRIEAYTGMRAKKLLSKRKELLEEIQKILGTSENLLLTKLKEKIEQIETLSRDKEILVKEFIRHQVPQLFETMKKINGEKIICWGSKILDKKALRMMADLIREKEKGITGLLFAEEKEKLEFIVFSNSNIDSGAIAKELGKKLGGGGGGSKKLAEGGVTRKESKKLCELFQEIVRKEK